jgi:hypothetical protein
MAEEEDYCTVDWGGDDGDASRLSFLLLLLLLLYI